MRGLGIIATIAFPALLACAAAPASADDDCPEEAIYCDHKASFRVEMPEGYRAAEAHSPEIAAQLITDMKIPGRLNCPIVSETFAYTDQLKDTGVDEGFWRELFRVAKFAFNEKDMVVVNNRDWKVEGGRKRLVARRNDEKAWNAHQLSMVHIRYLFNGKPFVAWQALYWKRTEYNGAKPIPSRIYFLNCTAHDDRTLDLRASRTPPFSRALFKSFTPIVCKSDEPNAACSEAEKLTLPEFFVSEGEAEGTATPVTDQMPLLLQSGVRAALSGTR